MEDLITVYWRPGCPYCVRLRSRLRRLGVQAREVNIWVEPEAAAVVRSFAGGNETVPTVVIDEVGMVNPSARQVLNELRRIAPHRAERLVAEPSVTARLISRLRPGTWSG